MILNKLVPLMARFLRVKFVHVVPIALKLTADASWKHVTRYPLVVIILIVLVLVQFI